MFFGAGATATQDEKAVAEGTMWTGQHAVSAFAQNTTLDFLITAPAGFRYRIAGLQVRCDAAPISFIFFSGTDATGGTSLTIYNENESQNPTARSRPTMTHTPTITAEGTPIFPWEITGQRDTAGNKRAYASYAGGTYLGAVGGKNLIRLSNKDTAAGSLNVAIRLAMQKVG